MELFVDGDKEERVINHNLPSLKVISIYEIGRMIHSEKNSAN